MATKPQNKDRSHNVAMIAAAPGAVVVLTEGGDIFTFQSHHGGASWQKLPPLPEPEAEIEPEATVGNETDE